MKPIESNVCCEWKPEIVEVSTNEEHIANGHVSTAMLCAQRLCDRKLVRCNLSTISEDEPCTEVCEETEEEPKICPCPKKKKKRWFLKLFLPILLLATIGAVLLCSTNERFLEEHGDRDDDLNGNENGTSGTDNPKTGKKDK